MLNETFVLNLGSLQYAKEGTQYPFVNDATVPGLWANQEQYICSDGSANQGGKQSLILFDVIFLF